MKNICFYLTIALLLTGCNKEKSNIQVFEINQNWQFRQVGSNEWLPSTVPGCVHADLRNFGKAPADITGANADSVQWIENEDWEYRTEFTVTTEQLNAAHNEIVFKGLDTYATVYLNDEEVLKADNMFRSWSIDAKPYLKKGKNRIRILFESPVRVGMEKLKAHPYPLIVANELAPEGEQTNIFTRKAPFHFGWDWGPRLVTSGIWRPILLKS